MTEETSVDRAPVDAVVSRWSWFIQRPNTGSRWFFGNFALGVILDSHPRFTNLVFCFGFVEIGISRKIG